MVRYYHVWRTRNYQIDNRTQSPSNRIRLDPSPAPSDTSGHRAEWGSVQRDSSKGKATHPGRGTAFKGAEVPVANPTGRGSAHFARVCCYSPRVSPRGCHAHRGCCSGTTAKVVGALGHWFGNGPAR